MASPIFPVGDGYDYAKLQSDMVDWLWREGDTDFSNKIPTLIKLAEARANRELRLTSMMVRAQFVGQNSRFVPIPGTGSDPEFLEMRSLRVKSDNNEFMSDQLIQVSPEGLRIKPRDVPSRYAVHEEIELDSALQAGYTLQMVYYTPFLPLTDTQTSNWLLQYAYDVYLYGALQEAEPFLRNDDRIAVWSARWAAGIDELKEAERRARNNQSEVRQMLDPSDSIKIP